MIFDGFVVFFGKFLFIEFVDRGRRGLSFCW